jgi:hypothetical protein
MARVCWLYFISKFTEFFDTFFFVLRKRYDQVSTLHIIHHGIMPFSGECWQLLTEIKKSTDVIRVSFLVFFLRQSGGA